MPAAADAATAEPCFTIDRATHSIRLTRELAAPPAQIFRAWTLPEHVACWWDAAGEKLALCEIDLRVGGSFRFVSAHHPERPFTGTYREIAPPDLLVFEAMGAIGSVSLTALGGGTRLTVEIACSSDEHLDQYLQMGVAVGTSQTLDNLVAYAGEGGL